MSQQRHALKGRRTRVVTVENSGPASLPGREKSLLVCPGGYARATPPANIRRPSGARNSFAEFASSISHRRFSFAFFKLKAASGRRTPKAVAISSQVVDCIQL
jgi:hypothetical protein